MLNSHNSDEPKNVEETFKSPTKDLWMKIIEEDMESIESKYVWDLINSSPNRKEIRNKWVILVKQKVNGLVESYKASLTTKGNTQ